MPSAGFYAVESGRISFRRDGNWYTDEERIDNRRIALLFSKSLRRNPDGSYFLQVGDERAPVEVEDTPWVVTAVDRRPDGRFILTLNDDEREELDCSSLEVGEADVLYCRVKGGQARARVLRPAYYHLSGFFEADEDGRFFLRCGAERFLIARTAGGGEGSRP